ncbi:MAG: hypothetical protein WAT67_02990 [Candidatus Contendobacter sp.]
MLGETGGGKNKGSWAILPALAIRLPAPPKTSKTISKNTVARVATDSILESTLELFMAGLDSSSIHTGVIH